MEEGISAVLLGADCSNKARMLGEGDPTTAGGWASDSSWVPRRICSFASLHHDMLAVGSLSFASQLRHGNRRTSPCRSVVAAICGSSQILKQRNSAVRRFCALHKEWLRKHENEIKSSPT